MTIALLDNNSATATSSTPRTISMGLSGLSGTDCLIVVAFSARDSGGVGFGFLTPTWNGVAMTQAVRRDSALNGFGQGTAAIWYLAIGTVSGLSASAVVTVDTSGSFIGLQGTVIAYSGVDQTTPLNATNNLAFNSSASSITIAVTTNPSTDRVVGCNCFAETSASGALPTSGQAKLTGISTTIGSPMAHTVAEEAAAASTSTAANWGSFTSSFSAVVASFVESAAPAPPAIINVNGGSFADPDETNLTVNGTDLDPGGNTTELHYADGTDFGTANTQIQAISAITNPTLNWDAINLGTIGEGDNFLFVVTDPGGGAEAISVAFPILVEQPEVFITRKIITTDGVLGSQLVVPIDFDNPQLAVIRGNSATAEDTVQPDAVYSICLVDTVGGKGAGCGSEDGPAAHQREHVEGTGSVFLLDGGTGPHLIEGTPSLTPSGLVIDFTINTAGHNLEIVVIGGKSVLAEVRKIAISDGVATGLSFRPDFLFAASACISGAGDSTFALITFGICHDQGGLGQFQLATNQSGSPRNSAVDNTAFLAQVSNSGTSYDWQMAITSINADGYSWSGSDSDEAFVAAIRVPGRKLFLTVFQKIDVAPGGEQDLPDIGFDPGGIFLVTAGRNPISLSPALGGRWSVGVVTAEGQDVSSASALPDSGTLVAEQYEDFDHCVATSSVPGSISMLGRMISFGQISRIRWENSLATNESQIGMFVIDATDFDDGGDIIGEHQF